MLWESKAGSSTGALTMGSTWDIRDHLDLDLRARVRKLDAHSRTRRLVVGEEFSIGLVHRRFLDFDIRLEYGHLQHVLEGASDGFQVVLVLLENRACLLLDAAAEIARTALSRSGQAGCENKVADTHPGLVFLDLVMIALCRYAHRQGGHAGSAAHLDGVGNEVAAFAAVSHWCPPQESGVAFRDTCFLGLILRPLLQALEHTDSWKLPWLIDLFCGGSVLL